MKHAATNEPPCPGCGAGILTVFLPDVETDKD
jgi:hypothetical protein